MSVIQSIENGLRYAFTARERPIEPAKEHLFHLTLVGTVNMGNSLMAHPGREAVEQANLRALHAVPKTALQTSDPPVEQAPEQVGDNVVNMAARKAIKDAGIEQAAQPPERDQLATVQALHYRSSDAIMGSMVDAVEVGKPMVQPEKLAS